MQIVTDKPDIDEARELIRELDTEIAGLYPQYEIGGIDAAELEKAGGYFVVARETGEAVGCGGFRPIDKWCAEIKRMFVRPEGRRRGIARQILRHLEAEARRQGFRTLVLETGCNNSAAIALYEAEGYFPIPAFLGYVGVPISRCFAKGLTAQARARLGSGRAVFFDHSPAPERASRTVQSSSPLSRIRPER